MTQRFVPADVHPNVNSQCVTSDILQPTANGQEYFCDSGLVCKAP